MGDPAESWTHAVIVGRTRHECYLHALNTASSGVDRAPKKIIITVPSRGRSKPWGDEDGRAL